MDKKLLVSVDEFSLVLFLPAEEVCENWVKAAYFMMNEFIELSKIELLLGKVVEMNKKKPQAYSQAFTIENVPYYFAIAFTTLFNIWVYWFVSQVRLGLFINKNITNILVKE